MTNLYHFIPFILLLVPLIYGLIGYFKNRGVQKKEITRQSTGKTIINSAILYALSFNVVFFVQELYLALGKKWLGLKAYLYHNNHNWDGSHPKEGLAQGLGALAILILGLVAAALMRFAKKKSWIYVLLAWISFQGFAQSLPQFITAFIARDTDTGQAFTYLKISDTTGLLISLACIFVMLWICTLYSRIFLELSPNSSMVSTSSSRFGFLFRITLIAAFIGAIICIPYRIMPWGRAAAPFMVTLITVPMIWAYGWKVSNVKTYDNSINHKIILWPIVISVLLLLFFQLVLAKGLVFE